RYLLGPARQLARTFVSWGPAATGTRRAAASWARAIAQAAVTRAMWLNGCGELPSISPLAASLSSARQPPSLAAAGPRPQGGRARQGLGLRQPERAEQEGSLPPGQAIVSKVAVDQAALVGQPGGGGVDGRLHPRVVPRQEAGDSQHQVGRVQVLAAEGLGKG